MFLHSLKGMNILNLLLYYKWLISHFFNPHLNMISLFHLTTYEACFFLIGLTIIKYYMRDSRPELEKLEKCSPNKFQVLE